MEQGALPPLMYKTYEKPSSKCPECQNVSNISLI